ncbi:MAG: hypothetical protein HKO07_06275, partial [Pseudomonadales bacterium]|nr:hypothetical protein [Pseudomonadales bacterium]
MPDPKLPDANYQVRALDRAAVGKLLLLQSAAAVFGIAALWSLPLLQSGDSQAHYNALLLQAIWPSAILLLLWISFAALLIGLHQRLPRSAVSPALKHRDMPGPTRAEQPPWRSDTTLHELDLARAQAIQSSRMKSSLIARASHELLTPLNCISGFAGILQREELAEPKRQEYLQLITDNADQLQTLVNDLISFADRHSDAINIVYKKTRIDSLLSSVARSFEQTAQTHKLDITLNIDAVQGIEIETDAARVRQMLSNLIVNAIRNTAEGQITLAATLDESNPHSAVLAMSVQDTGAGIAPQRLEALREELANSANVVRVRRRKHDTDNGENNFRIPGAGVPGLGFGLG